MTTTPPRWDLSNVYPSLDSKEFKAALAQIDEQIEAFEKFIQTKIATADQETATPELAKRVGELIERYNTLAELAYTVQAYISSYVATDSFNQEALKLHSEFDMKMVRVETLVVQTTQWIGKISEAIPAILKLNQNAAEHAFYLEETVEKSKFMMSEAEEVLAAELSLSGANAWNKLQGTVTSQLTVDFEVEGKVEKLPMPALINFRSHPDEATRRRAYEAETAAWETVKEPLAAALNGIKGTDNTLNRKRGYKDALQPSIQNSRMDRATLDAMLGAMRDSFPMFRKYFKSKAAKLGKDTLAWWDIFAPVGKTDKTYAWEEARDFILTSFATFTPELDAMARMAFEKNWIDAEMRKGKRGGAFCMGVMGVRESRILINFDGSSDQVSTLAHELGHAFHNYCLFKGEKSVLQGETPSTLAETASIMCETIVSQAVLKTAATREDELAILENAIQNAVQVIVDIYSRYLFEKEVFERREKSELSADDLCDIMERAQKATYGDGLDERYLQKFMWTWKPHYYYPGFAFYNYPYAFGLLFGTGLYAIYQQRGEAFVPDYMNLLASTGEANAADLAARFGIDIRTKKFWADSLAIIGEQIDRYCEL